MYEAILHPKVKKDLKKIDKSLLQNIKEKHIKEKLLIDPLVGKSLTGKLSGIYSYHLKFNNIEYRIAYSIFKDKKQVYIYSIGNRENFYKNLENRLNL